MRVLCTVKKSHTTLLFLSLYPTRVAAILQCKYFFHRYQIIVVFDRLLQAGSSHSEFYGVLFRISMPYGANQASTKTVASPYPVNDMYQVVSRNIGFSTKEWQARPSRC